MRSYLHKEWSGRTHMLLQILPYCWVVNLDINTRCFENFWVANAGQLKQLWRLYASGANYDFSFCADSILFASMYESHALCSPLPVFPFENHLLNESFRKQMQVLSSTVGFVVRSCRVAPFPFVWRHARE